MWLGQDEERSVASQLKLDIVGALERERDRLGEKSKNSTERLRLQQIEEMLDHLSATTPCLMQIEPEKPTWPIRL